MGTVSDTVTTFALRDQEKIGPSAADYSPNYLSTSLIVRVGKGVKRKNQARGRIKYRSPLYGGPGLGHATKYRTALYPIINRDEPLTPFPDIMNC